MTYNKPMFSVERPGLSSSQQKPKRLPGGASPSGRFASLLQESDKAANSANSIGQAAQATTIPKADNTKALLERMKAKSNSVINEMSSEATKSSPPPQALSTFAKVMQNSPTPLKTLDKLLSNPDLASQMGLGDDSELSALKDSPFMSSFHKMFRDLKAEQGELSVRTASHRRKGGKVGAIGSALKDMFKEKNNFSGQGADFLERLRNSSKGELGVLAAHFESGRDGSAAIGYDRGGGTSYGKYQIASKVGSMSAFISYLDSAAPDIAKKLKESGPANTGGRNGKMPTAWKQIAATEPERFERLQDKFIQASHYLPALGAISKATGIDPKDMPSAMHEVIFSTAVQHGPSGASRIFSRAFNQAAETINHKTKNNVNVATSKELGEALIKSVYNIRSDQFSAASYAVRGAVQNRLKSEMNIALTMLRENVA